PTSNLPPFRVVPADNVRLLWEEVVEKRRLQRQGDLTSHPDLGGAPPGSDPTPAPPGSLPHAITASTFDVHYLLEIRNHLHPNCSINRRNRQEPREWGERGDAGVGTVLNHRRDGKMSMSLLPARVSAASTNTFSCASA
uniref:Uncharacterized protein n=1 Tax=Triticum urartu TaxID=4572 RepID=A0A8R7V248_TRIUA